MAEVGRPSLYSAKILKQAEAYLANCVDKFDEVVKNTNVEGDPISYRRRLVVNLPSVAGLAVYLKIARSTIYKWAEAHPEFSDILERILAEQEKRLIENGLSGDYAATIAKLALGKHGYKDTSDITSNNEPISALTASDRAAIDKLHDVLKQSIA
jgi:hypothetical protein